MRGIKMKAWWFAPPNNLLHFGVGAVE